MKITHNKLLGGWYIVRGPHHMPMGGRYSTYQAALAALRSKKCK